MLYEVITLGIEAENQGASTGLHWFGNGDGQKIDVMSPVDGKIIASVHTASEKDYETVVADAP